MRRSEVDRALQLLEGGRLVAIQGKKGMGKTHTLKELARLSGGIYVGRITPKKQALVTIAVGLVRAGELELPDVDWREARYMDDDDLRRYFSKMTADLILALITEEKRRTPLFIDDLDLEPERAFSLFETLLETFPVCFSYTRGKRVLKYLYEASVIRLKPLSKEEILALIRPFDLPQRIESEIVVRSAGVPGVAVSLAKNPDSIKDSPPARKLNLTFALLLVISGAIITRFIALGTNDTDLYVLAGIWYGILAGLRYFIYRGMRD